MHTVSLPSFVGSMGRGSTSSLATSGSCSWSAAARAWASCLASRCRHAMRCGPSATAADEVQNREGAPLLGCYSLGDWVSGFIRVSANFFRTLSR